MVDFKKKVTLITSSPLTVKAFLMPFLNRLDVDYDVHIIANFTTKKTYDFIPSTVTIHSLPLERNPSLINDIKVLISLIKLLRKNRFDAIHTFTPKAGFVGQLAALFSGVKCRFHTFTGQVWVTRSGMSRFLFKNFDRLIGKMSTYSLVDSPSQREFLIDERVLTDKKSKVLGLGSISGVNTEKFVHSKSKGEKLKESLGIKSSSFVFLYAGRLKKDKGILELFSAFELVSERIECHLVIVGSDEENLLPLIKSNKNVSFCGFTDDISAFFSMSDLLCLPSHREGFGNVVIEAASCGLPALVSDIYGLTDAVENGVTGLLHKVGDVNSLSDGMIKLAQDESFLEQLGHNAEVRAKREFSEQVVVEQFIIFYQNFLK